MVLQRCGHIQYTGSRGIHRSVCKERFSDLHSTAVANVRLNVEITFAKSVCLATDVIT